MPALGQTSKAGRTYFGFDRNEYPGDNLLPSLHRNFSYAGYWLNIPPAPRAMAGQANAPLSRRTVLAS